MKEKKENGNLKIDNNTSRRISTYGRWLKGTKDDTLMVAERCYIGNI